MSQPMAGTWDLDLIGAPAFALEPFGDTFRYVGLNSRLELLTGLRSSHLVSKTPADVLPPSAADEATARFRRCVSSREAIDYEVCHALPGGTRWWAVTLTPVIEPSPQQIVIALLGIAVDITRRREAEIARQDALAHAALAMDLLEGGFWHINLETNETHVSPSLASLLAGDRTEGLSVEAYMSFVEPEDIPEADVSALRSGSLDEATVEYRVRNIAGEQRWIQCKRRLIRTEGGRPRLIIGAAIDVTEQKALQARFRRQALTDVLTGLPNRRSLEINAQHRILESCRTGQPFGLLFLDLDGFKPVNDHFGHPIGDAVLREIAVRLRRETRDQDHVARFGGDEFCVLVDEVDAKTLRRLSRTMQAALIKPILVDGFKIKVGVSIGTTIYHPSDVGLDDLTARADYDLYRVKNTHLRPSHDDDETAHQPLAHRADSKQSGQLYGNGQAIRSGGRAPISR